MKWPWQRAETRSYSDGVLQSILAAAGITSTKAKASQTAALEAAAGLVGRAFATAQVTGSERVRRAVTPALLTLVGRSLIRWGEIVYAIEPGMGGVALVPASSHDITGGFMPDTWVYRLNVSGPTEQSALTRHAENVLHFTYATDPIRPWQGLGPLQFAAIGGDLAAHVSKVLADEASGPRGYLLPVPVDGQSSTIEDLTEDLGKMAGRTALVESTAGNWGDGGRAQAPQADWKPQRIGTAPPEALVKLNEQADAAVLAACGIPPELLQGGDGTAAKQAWARLLAGTVTPLGRLVAHELSTKLGEPVSFAWAELRAADLEGRARVLSALVKAELPIDKAQAIAGLAS